MDYMSLRKTKDSMGKLRLLVGKDKWTQLFFCYKVQHKGAQDRHTIDNVLKAIESMGHTKITLVTDGEPAIL